MKKYSVFIVLLLMHTEIYSQAVRPAIQWQKRFGGKGNDRAQSMQITMDGGYIVAGYYSAPDSSIGRIRDGNLIYKYENWDYWIIKMDSKGNLQWQKKLGGSRTDFANYIIQTEDKGYMVVGSANSSDRDLKNNCGGAWIVKLDNYGNIKWQRKLGNSIISSAANCIQDTHDGGYIVAGWYLVDSTKVADDVGGDINYWVTKIDRNGTILWKNIGSNEMDDAISIQDTKDGGCIMIASGSSKHYVIKFNNTGKTEWQKKLDDEIDINGPNSLLVTKDDHYVIVGTTYIRHGNADQNDADACVLKLDNKGNVIWKKSFGGSGDDITNCISETSDNNFVIAGCSTSNDGPIKGNHGSGDGWIFKLNNNADLIWQACFGGRGFDGFTAVNNTIDGGYILSGWCNSKDPTVKDNYGGDDVWVLKLRPDL